MDDLTRIVILSSASAIDDLSTAVACTFYGTKLESHKWRRKLMDKFGMWKSLPLQTIISQAAYFTPILATYQLEKYAHTSFEPWAYKGLFVGFTALVAYTLVNNAFAIAYLSWEKNANKHASDVSDIPENSS